MSFFFFCTFSRFIYKSTPHVCNGCFNSGAVIALACMTSIQVKNWTHCWWITSNFYKAAGNLTLYLTSLSFNAPIKLAHAFVSLLISLNALISMWRLIEYRFFVLHTINWNLKLLLKLCLGKNTVVLYGL